MSASLVGSEMCIRDSSSDLKEVRLPSCVIRRTPSGLKYKADTRRAEQLVHDLLLVGSGPVANGPSIRAAPLQS
eukprot:5033257-Alexandrium_andersonii.AAC.1